MWWLVRAVCLLLLFWTGSKVLQAWLTRRAKAAALSWIPGPPSIPFLGTLQLIGLSKTRMFRQRTEFCRKYGPIYKIWMFNEPKIFISGFEYYKLILTDKTNISKGDLYELSKHFLGNGIITSDGDHWFTMRRLATPSFHLERLDSVPSEVLPHLKTLLQQLDSCAQTDQPFRALPYLQIYALNMNLVIFMGFNKEDIDEFQDHQMTFAHAIETMAEIVINRAFNPLLNSDFLYRFSHLYKLDSKVKSDARNYARMAIEQRRRRKSTTPVRDQGSKNLVLYDNITNLEKDPLPEETLLNEINHFLFAGFDTVSATIELALFHLGNHPEEQERLREEALEMCGDILESGIKYSQLNRLDHLDRFVKEVLRITPTVDIISRNIVTPINTKKGVIPAGFEVVMDLYNLHQDETIYPEPRKLDSDRFLHQNRADRDPFSYAPFSAGPRNCIGSKVALIQIKITLIAVLLRYSVQSTETLDNLNWFSNVVLRSENGLDIKLKKLHS